MAGPAEHVAGPAEHVADTGPVEHVADPVEHDADSGVARYRMSGPLDLLGVSDTPAPKSLGSVCLDRQV